MQRPGSDTSLARASARLLAVAATVLAAALFAGCGGSGGGEGAGATGVAAIKAADQVDKADFPQTDGAKTLEQIRTEADALPTDETALVPAANNFVAGRPNRLPFGLFTVDRTPIWGQTVMYVSTGPDAPAAGPFVVAANALDVPKRYRSKTSASDYETFGSGFYTAVFNAGENVPKVELLTLTKDGDQTRSAIASLKLVKDDPSPAPGEQAPPVKTDKLGDTRPSQLCTNEPIDDMHDHSLDEVLGKGKPVVLVFSTPAFCESRVCGPVNDVATQVQAETGDDVVFIHSEIFKNNDPDAGYRPAVTKYGLTSEPYTFVIDGDGVVAAQLAGPFVAEELRAALKVAGLK